MAARKRRTARAKDERPEPPSDAPDAVRQLSEENVRKAAEALRVLKLPNEAEPCTVFKP